VSIQRSGPGRTGRMATMAVLFALAAHAEEARTIHQAVLGESNQRTSEVSTEELWPGPQWREGVTAGAVPH
jgi:hypothetical protein